MGKTVPSFRMALESEIARWRTFRSALSNEEDRVSFDALMDMCRNLASAGGCATNPIIFEPMVISIMLTQQKKLRELERRVKDVLPGKTCVEHQQG